MSWFRDPQVHEFSDRASKGRGFLIAGKRTVHHTSLELHNSAAVSITADQKLFLFVSCLLVSLLLFISWKAVVFTLVCVLTAFYFIDLLFGLFLAYRSFSKNPEIQVSQAELDRLKETDLPTYTVFCPLYKEWQVLPQFIDAMQQLDYPKSKLQVMLQLEEDDTETVARARAMDLPEYFEIVVVPNAKPKTKPKAMNYGLQFATGDIITIYDAEDMPEASQLKKVVVAFNKLPDNVVCVQGKLNFYNPGQNLLTRMFTAEYSLWFDLILPGLQSIGAPIPLGGTSNNFKKSVLQELAGWDAYNVTEDCDLGMRLAKKGYTTAIVDSTTLEEANSGYHNWYRQRSRWIKGYMQTYLVHMRSPRAAVREFGLRNFLLLQLTVGGKVLSMFVNPLLWLITIAYFVARTHVAPVIEPFFPPTVLYVGVISLIFGNFFYVYAYLIGLAKRREFRVMKFVFLVPLYWLGMSVAAWKALYELVVKPHYWQKTNHGLHLAQSEQRQETPVSTREPTRGGRDKRQENPIPIPEPVYTAPVLVQELVQTLQVEAQVTPHAPVKAPFELIPEEDVESATSGTRLDSGVDPRRKVQATRFDALFSLRAFVRSQFHELKTDNTVREGAWLVAGSVAANFFNFLFNAVLGRTLSLDDFGLVTLFNTILGLLAVVFNGVASAVTH
ncbi:MAG: glycosyltransferase, partial [Candidatus Doudnabacteria bacterium]|nr:glycosyltransferase [Candidatus Doudnabacteria bacterium]